MVGTFCSLKMPHQVVFTLIASLITYSLIFEPVPVHSAPENVQNKTEMKFVCEQAVVNIDNCEKNYCQTKGVKMLKKCDASYVNNEAIKQKCEKWPTDEEKSQNQFLTLPAISTANGIVYWNMYCALCNHVDEFEFGDALLLYATIEQCGLSLFYNFKFALSESIQSKYVNALCIGNTSRVIREDLLKSDNYCVGKPISFNFFDSEFRLLKQYCKVDPIMYCPELPFREDLFCTYGSELGQFCLYDAFLFEGVNFAYGENGNVYVSTSPTYRPTNKFRPEEYFNLTDRKGVIYVCGNEGDGVLTLKILIVLSYSVSTVFYILCIILNSNKQSLQNLPNRTLYSLCITSLMYSILQLHIYFPTIDGSCIAAEVAHAFLSMSSLLWTLVVFYEHSRVLYFSIRKLKMPAEELTKKYLIYCAVCWILPAIPTMFTSILISLAAEKSSSCPKLENYSVFYCGLDRGSHKYAGVLFEINDTLQSICTNILTVGCFGIVLTMVYLRWLRSRNSSATEETSYPIVFGKNVLTCVAISSRFMLFLLLDVTGSTVELFLLSAFEVYNGLQGVLIFFVCYYEKEMVSNLRVWYNLRKNSPENVGIYEQQEDNVSQSSRD